MKRLKISLITGLVLLLMQGAMAKKLNVITTLTDYANIAKYIGGDKIDVHAIVKGNQDAHFVRPKPSYAVMLSKADVFVSTGLDLELWVPTLEDRAANPHIRSGQPGFVAASDGVKLLDKPKVLSRSEGGLHIYGNPHIITSPVNFKVIARNIEIGLEKNDAANAGFYRANLKKFLHDIDTHLFGEKLIKMMGGKLLGKLAVNGQLIPFLQKKSFKGQKLISYLGGWMKKALPFRGRKLVSYHKNWVYFHALFGIKVVGTVEPKPGIPPSPKHVEELVTQMRKENVKVLMAANYFSEAKVNEICSKVGAVPVMVPMGVDGADDTENVFKLVDYWLDHLNKAYAQADAK